VVDRVVVEAALEELTPRDHPMLALHNPSLDFFLTHRS
jgi:hypothetical protein